MRLLLIGIYMCTTKNEMKTEGMTVPTLSPEFRN